MQEWDGGEMSDRIWLYSSPQRPTTDGLNSGRRCEGTSDSLATEMSLRRTHLLLIRRDNTSAIFHSGWSKRKAFGFIPSHPTGSPFLPAIFAL